jgi:hypothetical protein
VGDETGLRRRRPSLRRGAAVSLADSRRTTDRSRPGGGSGEGRTGARWRPGARLAQPNGAGGHSLGRGKAFAAHPFASLRITLVSARAPFCQERRARFRANWETRAGGTACPLQVKLAAQMMKKADHRRR